ncbi:YaaR family protein [Mesobacillus harenae]|uniref:YaaR family protein n=1 Tax=Mesobacillus harenae TaxID=2213203 RepID=UPI00157FD6FE|nr:YaaR family protein [Mesobacillus harenae]
MKINHDQRLNIEKTRQDQKQQVLGGNNFNRYIQSQGQKLHMGELQRLLGQIDFAGERLGRSRTFKDLAKFKNLVKQFVRETVDFGMDLKQSHSWSPNGQGRSLTIVDVIDQKLVELTEDVIKKKEGSIDLLGKIGEIKGLLINLYT